MATSNCFGLLNEKTEKLINNPEFRAPILFSTKKAASTYAVDRRLEKKVVIAEILIDPEDTITAPIQKIKKIAKKEIDE